MQIEGGTGTGFKAEVDQHNRLAVVSTSDSGFHHTSRDHGFAFSWTAVTADLAAAATAILLCNNDPDRYLIIDNIYLWCDVATQLKVHVPPFAAWSGTAITGVNMNRTSANIALASCYANEVTNALAAATTIVTLHTNELTTDQYAASINLYNALVLGYHDSVAVDIVEDSAAFEATIFGYFEDR